MTFNIPTELKKLHQWVVYDKKKIPYNPILDLPAQINNPDTWLPFEVVYKYLSNSKYNGIGFVLQKSNNIVCIDIDKCIEDGKINENVISILNHFPKKCYIELSPNNGLHIIVKGNLNKSYKKNKIELYNDKRYITVTGNKLQGDTVNINTCQEGIDFILKDYFDESVMNNYVGCVIDKIKNSISGK
jgi:primase-polymerase (primpol)-like protein